MSKLITPQVVGCVEIQLKILEHVLLLPMSKLITPQVVSGKWKRRSYLSMGIDPDLVEQPFFETTNDDLVEDDSEFDCDLFEKSFWDPDPEPCVFPGLITINDIDESDKYTEMRYSRRKVIDPTCLRVCRSFLDIGNYILYRRNGFHFNMTNTNPEYCPPSLIEGRGEFQPRASKPKLGNYKFSYSVMEGMSTIDNQVRVTELPGWIYYDKFLRFLHTIGKRNAALLRSLTFQGEVRFYRRIDSHAPKCEDDLLGSLKLYLPFIKKFCPRLKEIDDLC
ncbi:hypothetical protein EG329_002469 [Mollisiaceae sp. DMI_Dod_QoI]|nr:hypothetical protein EG329_002469 [Helotiales sp. DMI_Dod_QoI]